MEQRYPARSAISRRVIAGKSAGLRVTVHILPRLPLFVADPRNTSAIRADTVCGTSQGSRLHAVQATASCGCRLRGGAAHERHDSRGSSAMFGQLLYGVYGGPAEGLVVSERMQQFDGFRISDSA